MKTDYSKVMVCVQPRVLGGRKKKNEEVSGGTVHVMDPDTELYTALARRLAALKRYSKI